MEKENPKLINGCMVEGDFVPCVFDDPDYNVDDCNYAPDLQRSGTGRDGCKYWKPDAIPSDVRAVDELTELRAENARLLQSALASQRDADKLLEKLHAAERDNAALIDLVQHMWVHAGYPNNGYMQMTTPQKELFDKVKHGE